MENITSDTSYVKYHDKENGYTKEIGNPYGNPLSFFTLEDIKERQASGSIKILKVL